MPIEIRELVIKATIAQEQDTTAGSAATRATGNESPAEALVNTCVEKVLEIIKERNGR